MTDYFKLINQVHTLKKKSTSRMTAEGLAESIAKHVDDLYLKSYLWKTVIIVT